MPPILAVRRGGGRGVREPIMGGNGGSKVTRGHYEGEQVPGMITRAMLGNDVPLHTLSTLHNGRVRPYNPHYPPEWAPVPPLRTASRGGVRLEPGTHEPQCTGSRVTPIHSKAP